MMATSSMRLTNRFKGSTLIVREYLARTISATGKDIAEATRENMTPGHFLDTGLSQDQTRWEQLEELAGQVHIPTEYAAYPEFGTAHMAPRPALTPAVEAVWPEQLHRNWIAAPLLPPADAPEPPGPAIDKNGDPV